MPYLTDLADACRKSGLRVVEQPGWRTRGHGSFTRVSTIMCHHTAGPATGEAPSLNVVQNGRPGLAGPLSQIVLGRSGTVYVVAAGVAWHAGNTRVSWEGNYYAIGIEAEATGVSAWPAVQYDAYVRLCRALIDHYRLTPANVVGHKEAAVPAGRKIDPNFSMPAFRDAVTRAASGGAPTPGPAPAPKKRLKPVIISHPLVKGDQTVRLPVMNGRSSAAYGRAVVSVSAQGGATGTLYCQLDTDRNDIPPTGTPGGVIRVDCQNGSRNWNNIPDGAEYIEGTIRAGGPGFVCIEFLNPKQ